MWKVDTGKKEKACFAIDCNGVLLLSKAVMTTILFSTNLYKNTNLAAAGQSMSISTARFAFYAKPLLLI